MIDIDNLRERVRERARELDDYNHGHCDNCHADLTAADVEADECTACHSQLTSTEEDFDWYNANGMFDEDEDD